MDLKLSPNETILREWDLASVKKRGDNGVISLTVTDKRLISSEIRRKSRARYDILLDKIRGVTVSKGRTLVALILAVILLLAFALYFRSFGGQFQTIFQASFDTEIEQELRALFIISVTIFFLAVIGGLVSLIFFVINNSSTFTLIIHGNFREVPVLSVSNRRRTQNGRVRIKINRKCAIEVAHELSALLMQRALEEGSGGALSARKTAITAPSKVSIDVMKEGGVNCCKFRNGDSENRKKGA